MTDKFEQYKLENFKNLSTKDKVEKFDTGFFITQYDALLVSILSDLVRQNNELKNRLNWLESRAVLHPED